MYKVCLLYTSDAADERSSVDLGGRRIIKKKKKKKNRQATTMSRRARETIRIRDERSEEERMSRAVPEYSRLYQTPSERK